MNIDLSRRLATSTRPWSSTSPSTSSCRWFSARRWCTPTTSSSSRWTNSQLAFDKNAFQAQSFFQAGYFDGYDPYTNPSAASGFTSAAFRWKNLQGCTGSTLELAGESKTCFLWQRNIFMTEKYFYGREILQTVQKSPSHREDEQSAKANRISFMSRNIENIQTKPWHWPHLFL